MASSSAVQIFLLNTGNRVKWLFVTSAITLRKKAGIGWNGNLCCCSVIFLRKKPGNRVKWQVVLPTGIIKKAKNRVKWQFRQQSSRSVIINWRKQGIGWNGKFCCCSAIFFKYRNRVKWLFVTSAITLRKKAGNRVKWQVVLLFSNLFKKETRE